ncbi:MAG: hypothetical protein GF311_15400 [Candidatus Lokiarchaeota archaeon]|nr:hypothetical protein [Candidatus Lokiarchaeota archaeon]
MSEKSLEKTFRGQNILIGLLMIFIAILALFFPNATNIAIVLLLSIGLLIAGISRIINALSDQELKNYRVIGRFISGLVAVIVSLGAVILAITDQSLALSYWYFFLAVSFLIIGLARILLAITSKEYDNWFRILLLIVGITTLILSLLIFLIPGIGGLYVVVSIAISLLLNGVARLLLGIIGE